MSLLFDLLLEHWEAADVAADRAWLKVWRKVEARTRGIGLSPSEPEIADAFVLRCEADKLLQALHAQLSQEFACAQRLHGRERATRGSGKL